MTDLCPRYYTKRDALRDEERIEWLRKSLDALIEARRQKGWTERRIRMFVKRWVKEEIAFAKRIKAQQRKQ